MTKSAAGAGNVGAGSFGGWRGGAVVCSVQAVPSHHRSDAAFAGSGYQPAWLTIAKASHLTEPQVSQTGIPGVFLACRRGLRSSDTATVLHPLPLLDANVGRADAELVSARVDHRGEHVRESPRDLVEVVELLRA